MDEPTAEIMPTAKGFNTAPEENITIWNGMGIIEAELTKETKKIPKYPHLLTKL
jgi:hypothetical protein